MVDEMDEVKLRVLTLNCWGVPFSFFSKKRKERFAFIAEELMKGNYDVVILEEVFDEEDFKGLKLNLGNVFPYTNLYYSGWLGGDLCIFSAYPLSNIMQYEYSVRGYPHAALHGDWYTGSSAGYCLINHPIKPIHCFITHLHAVYNPSDDKYFCHRVVQAYQLSQFVEQLRRPGEPTLVIGDMNTEPGHLCYKILIHVGRLKDSWLESGHTDESDFSHTYASRDNTFSGTEGDKGIRIDYILFNAGNNNLHCLDSQVTMRQIPGQDFCYSDHNGVASTFVLKRDSISEKELREAVVDNSSNEAHKLLVETLQESVSTISHFISDKSQVPHLHFLAFILLSVIFIFSPLFVPEFLISCLLFESLPFKIFFLISRVSAICVMIWISWDILINRRSELHVLKNTRADISWQLRYNKKL